MNTVPSSGLVRKLFLFLGLGAVFVALTPGSRAQVSANLLPALTSTGDYVRDTNERVRVVAISEGGITLECTHESSEGLRPEVWRERYSVRDGRLVLDAVFTPHIVPPQPAHTEWQMAAAIGTTNIGPMSLNPRWSVYKDYLQAVIESVQAAWLREVASDPSPRNSDSFVTVKFVMNSSGAITQILDVHEDGRLPASATVPCIRAINLGSPYGPWSEDMVAALGSQQVMSLSFHYE